MAAPGNDASKTRLNELPSVVHNHVRAVQQRTYRSYQFLQPCECLAFQIRSFYLCTPFKRSSYFRLKGH